MTIGNTYLADTSYYSPGSFGKRMAGSGSLSSLWKISLSLLMVSQCHLHTSIILYFQCYQTTGLNIFCETLLGFWGRQRLRWLNDITDSRDLKVKVAQSCGTLCDLMDYI